MVTWEETLSGQSSTRRAKKNRWIVAMPKECDFDSLTHRQTAVFLSVDLGIGQRVCDEGLADI